MHLLLSAIQSAPIELLLIPEEFVVSPELLKRGGQVSRHVINPRSIFVIGGERSYLAPRLSALPSEWILALTAMRVDPNQVAEVFQAARTRATPATVANSAHRRVNLVVDGR